MLKLTRFVYFVLLLYSVVFETQSKFVIPDITIEALKNGSFRAYIPDSKSINHFIFHAKLNQPIVFQDPGDYAVETDEKHGNFWIASFPNANVKVGDRIYYWVFVYINRLGYQRDHLNTTITELFNEYPSLKPRCVVAATIINGKETCIGDTIFEEQFSMPIIDKEKWIIEQWIPTLTAPNFIFNSYVNKDETRRITNGVLDIQPVAYKNDLDIRGVLDLTNGCTSKIESECIYRSKSYLLLPPVQSAKIASKTSFKYGKIDVRAKLPAGDWLVPVIRLESKDHDSGGTSPIVLIAYSRGNEHLTKDGTDIGAQIVFGGPLLPQDDPNQIQQLPLKRSSDPFYKEFHVYSLEWKPDKMTFSVDNTEYGSVDLTKSFASSIDIRGISTTEKEYVITLGVSVGGLTDFPDGFISGNNPKPWSNSEPTFIRDFFAQRSKWLPTWTDDGSALHVDYVKVTAI